MRARQHGQGLLALGIEQALFFETALELLEGQLQRAASDRFEMLDVDLIFAARFVHADGAAHGDVQAVLGAEFQAQQLLAEADAANLRFGVLQREVAVAGLRGVGVGDFAFHLDVGEFAREQVADARGEVADGPDAALGHQRQLQRAHFLSHPMNQKTRVKPTLRSREVTIGKIEAAAAAFDGDVAGEASEAEGQARAEQEEGASGDEDEAADEEEFAEFAGGVHG